MLKCKLFAKQQMMIYYKCTCNDAYAVCVFLKPGCLAKVGYFLVNPYGVTEIL